MNDDEVTYLRCWVCGRQLTSGSIPLHRHDGEFLGFLCRFCIENVMCSVEGVCPPAAPSAANGMER